MLNGLDLFSGIGGISLALSPWVRPAAYCEVDRHATSVLLSRMADGLIEHAPVWDDVSTLDAGQLNRFYGRYVGIDLIYGGFPCQDISVAGAGRGLDGERSGLFYQIARLCGELEPGWVFLENVPAITCRGGREVVESLTSLGYDCRWTVLSAAAIGAAHLRKRWWLLAYTNNQRLPKLKPQRAEQQGGPRPNRLAVPASFSQLDTPKAFLVRGNDGIPARMDRIRGLGNAVVPIQARTAFEILAGIKKQGAPQ